MLKIICFIFMGFCHTVSAQNAASVQNGQSSNNLNDVYAIDSSTAIAVGKSGTIIRTTNQGKNWYICEIPYKSDLNSIFFIDNTTGWITGSNGLILKSTDSGETWNKQVSNCSYFLNSVHFANSNTGLIAGAEGTILMTHDGGSKWYLNLYSVPYTPDIVSITAVKPYFTSVFMSAPEIACIVGWEGIIIKTDDGGKNWTLCSNNSENYINSVWFTDQLHGFAVAGKKNPDAIYNNLYGIILRMGTSCYTWREEWLGIAPLTSIFFINKNIGWITGTANQIIKKTIDGGISWYPQAGYPFSPMNSIHFANETDGWAVGAYGVILHSIDGGDSWINESNNITSLNLQESDTKNVERIFAYSIFPNPFNNNCTFQFRLINPMQVKLHLYSLNGQRMAVLIDGLLSAGEHSVNWDGRNERGLAFPSGIYFSKLVIGSSEINKKLILLR